MKILIVTGGHISVSFARDFLKANHFDRIIAADAGLAACHKLALVPTDILGDFDSLSNLELREFYREKGIPVREFPTRKDYTDTHLAIMYAVDLWIEEGKNERNVDKTLTKEESGVWVLGATGTRMDHTLSNIGMLISMADQQIPCTLADEHNIMEILKGPVCKTYQRDPKWKYFSLLPFSPEVTGLDLEGFSYPLHDAVMREFESLGISNEIDDEYGVLRMKTGYMLVVRARD